MSSPATMRLVGLLVIVGMVVGCGAERTGPDRASAIVGTYQFDVERTVEQAVELALIHDAEWTAAKTTEDRARARRAFAERIQEEVDGWVRQALTLRADGTFEHRIDWWPDQADYDLPRVFAGTWRASGNEVFLVATRVDGQPWENPSEDRYVHESGSLYRHLDEVERADAAFLVWEREDGRFEVSLKMLVLTKE